MFQAISKRWAEVHESYQDADAAMASCPGLEEMDLQQTRMMLAMDNPNLTFVGCEILRVCNEARFLYETALYVVLGRYSMAWENEINRQLCEEADEQLLSYAY